MPADREAFLDRPAARLVALLVLVACGGVLALVHRDDFKARELPGEVGVETAKDDPAAPCMTERFAEIDGMVDEGIVDSAQAALFKQRAEAMCRATTGDGGQGLPLPLE